MTYAFADELERHRDSRRDSPLHDLGSLLGIGKGTLVEDALDLIEPTQDDGKHPWLQLPNLVLGNQDKTPQLPPKSSDGSLPRLDLGKKKDPQTQLQTTSTQLDKTDSKSKKKKKKHKKSSFLDILGKVGITAGACLTESAVDYYMFNLARQKDQQSGDGKGETWQKLWHGVQAGVLIPGLAGLTEHFGGIGSSAGFLGAQMCATNDMLYYWMSNWLPGHGKEFKKNDGTTGKWDQGYPQDDNINWMNWSPAAWLPKLFGGDVHRNDQGEQTITRSAFQTEAAIGGGLAMLLPILGDVTGLDDTVHDWLGW